MVLGVKFSLASETSSDHRTKLVRSLEKIDITKIKRSWQLLTDSHNCSPDCKPAKDVHVRVDTRAARSHPDG